MWGRSNRSTVVQAAPDVKQDPVSKITMAIRGRGRGMAQVVKY
jgi:hypothetical protein